MTPRAAFAIAGAGALSWVVLAFLALMLFALSGCATVRTPRGIAATLDRCLAEQAPRLRAQGERPLAWQCACVADAKRTCTGAGLAGNCAFDGWNVADRLDGWRVAYHDAWTIAVCRQMQEEKP